MGREGRGGGGTPLDPQCTQQSPPGTELYTAVDVHTLTHSHPTPSHTHTLTHSHPTPSHTHTLTHSHPTPSHTHTLTYSYPHTLTSYTLTYSYPHTFTSYTLTYSYPHTFTSYTLTYSYPHTLTSYTLTYSYPHTLTCSPFPVSGMTWTSLRYRDTNYRGGTVGACEGVSSEEVTGYLRGECLVLLHCRQEGGVVELQQYLGRFPCQRQLVWEWQNKSMTARDP